MFDDTNYNNWAKRNPTPAIPKSHTDLFWAEYDRETFENGLAGETVALQEIMEQYVDETEEATGTRPVDPAGVFNFTMSPYFETDLKGLSTEEATRKLQSRRTDNLGASRAVFRERLDKLNKTREEAGLLPITDDEMWSKTAGRIRGAVEDADAAQQTADGWLDGLFSFAGTAWGALTTVETAATLPLGASGKSVLGIAAKEAGLAMVVEAGIEPVKRDRAEFAGLPERTLGRAASDVGMAGAATFGLSALVAGAGKGLARKFGVSEGEIDVDATIAQAEAKADEMAREFTDAIHTKPLEETEIGKRVKTKPFVEQTPEERMAERINDDMVMSRPPEPRLDLYVDDAGDEVVFNIKGVGAEIEIDSSTKIELERHAQINVERLDDGSFQIVSSSLPASQRGKGVGKKFYKDVVDYGFDTASASKVVSDTSVSEDAIRIYQSLEGEGYRVTFNDNVQKNGKQWMSLDDRPVVEITGRPKPHEQKLKEAIEAELDPQAPDIVEIAADSDFRETGRKIITKHRKAKLEAGAAEEVEIDDAIDGVFKNALEQGEINMDELVYFDDGTSRSLQEVMDEFDNTDRAINELADCAGL